MRAQAVAFGMGGGLLQKLNRDTLSFATKLSHIVYADGRGADIMKAPAADKAKISFPGAAALAPTTGGPQLRPPRMRDPHPAYYLSRAAWHAGCSGGLLHACSCSR